MTEPFSEREMLEHSARAIGKLAGRRDGAFLVTHTEIEAMAMTLLVLGMPPLKYGYKINNHAAFFQNLTDRFGVKT